MNAKRVALYARVSTDFQTCDNQLQELRAVADRNGWVVVQEYTDTGISGAKGRDKRPAFDAMIKASIRKEFDVVMCWSVDRLGRSLQHLISFLGDIEAKGVDLYLHQQGLDTTTPSGKMMFQLCGIFSEYERAMIRSRVMAGLARSNKKSGRPSVSTKVIADIHAKRATGMSLRKISKEVGVGVSTVQRTLKVA